MQLQRHLTVDKDVDTICTRQKQILVQRSTNNNCAADKSMIRQIGSATEGGGIRRSVEGVDKAMHVSGQTYGFRCVHRPCFIVRKSNNQFTDTFLYGSDDGISRLNPMTSSTFSIVSTQCCINLLLLMYRAMGTFHEFNEFRRFIYISEISTCIFQRYHLVASRQSDTAVSENPYFTAAIRSSSSSVICQTTGPKPLPKRFLHIVRSRASSFN